MKKMAFWTLILTWGIALTGVLPAAAAPRYNCKDLGTLYNGKTYPYGINAAGQVVGKSASSSMNYHAFLYSGGVMQDLGTLGGSNSCAYAINASGQVVGYTDTPQGPRAFLYSGSMVNLGTLPTPYNSSSYAYGINAAGQVVGYSVGSSNQSHAFLYSGGMVDLGTLPAPYNYMSKAYGINAIGMVAGYSMSLYNVTHASLGNVDLQTLPEDWASQAYCVNDSGQVAGDSLSTNSHAFRYSSGGMVGLGTLPAPYNGNSHACGINNAGQVVGSSYNSDTHLTHAFLYSGGVMLDLNNLVNNPPPQGPLLEATGINDRGQIIAYGVGTGGFIHAYLLTPTSTPVGALELLLQ
jgi:probable HAF family extracellular repeat protein